MSSHFERVRESMKSQGSGDQEWQDIPSDQNELTAGIKRR